MFLFVLLCLSRVFEDVYIVIDGLDECATPRDNLLSLLLTLGSSPHMHIFISSRFESDINAALLKKPRLAMEKEFVKLDIAKHIDCRLDYDDRLKTMTPDLKNEVRVKLLEKSDGMLVI